MMKKNYDLKCELMQLHVEVNGSQQFKAKLENEKKREREEDAAMKENVLHGENIQQPKSVLSKPSVGTEICIGGQTSFYEPEDQNLQ